MFYNVICQFLCQENYICFIKNSFCSEQVFCCILYKKVLKPYLLPGLIAFLV